MVKVSAYQIENGCAIPKEKPTKRGQKLSGKIKEKIYDLLINLHGRSNHNINSNIRVSKKTACSERIPIFLVKDSILACTKHFCDQRFSKLLQNLVISHILSYITPKFTRRLMPLSTGMSLLLTLWHFL